MKKETWALVVAAAVAASPALAQDEPRQSEQAQQAAQVQKPRDEAAGTSRSAASLPAGVKARDAEDPADIHSTFDAIAEAAVTKDGFDDVIERLVDQDRNRIGNVAEEESAELNKLAEQIRRSWKDKYGEDLEVDPKGAFGSVALLRGEIEDPKQVARAWPVPAAAAGDGADARTAGAAQRAAAENQQGNQEPNLNSNIEKGRDVAIATIPAAHGLPEIRASLIREAQGWRIDVPNNLDGRQIRDNLVKHLQQVAGQSAQWPADKNEASLLLTHHVLMAVYNIDAPRQGQQQ